MASQKASAYWVGWTVGICTLFLCSFAVASFIVPLQQMPREQLGWGELGPFSDWGWGEVHPFSDTDRLAFLTRLKPEDARAWSVLYGKAHEGAMFYEEAPFLVTFNGFNNTHYTVIIGFHDLYSNNFLPYFEISATTPKGDEYRIDPLAPSEGKLLHRLASSRYAGTELDWELVHKDSNLITLQIRNAVYEYIAASH